MKLHKSEIYGWFYSTNYTNDQKGKKHKHKIFMVIDTCACLNIVKCLLKLICPIVKAWDYTSGVLCIGYYKDIVSLTFVDNLND